MSPTQVQSTRAGQLALFVAYDSPVMCVCDHPGNLRGQPGLDFLKIVPTVWDETRVLSGAVGEHLVIARRSGTNWFLGALNNSYSRVRSIKLDFLGAGRWHLRWWHDAPTARKKPSTSSIEERDRHRRRDDEPATVAGRWGRPSTSCPSAECASAWKPARISHEKRDRAVGIRLERGFLGGAPPPWRK